MRRWVGPHGEIGSGPTGLLIGIERTALSRKRETMCEVWDSGLARSGSRSLGQGIYLRIFPLLRGRPTKERAGRAWGIGLEPAQWLTTGPVAYGKGQIFPFKQALDHAHSLRLKSQADWKAYCKSGDKPDNIPASPWHVYVSKGWVGWGDWLGTGVTATRARQYR